MSDFQLTSSMTSMRSNAAFANRRRPAKTEKVGFLHLTDETRHRIYELAIFDHDRDVVMLPRALPRKTTPHTDVEIACLYTTGEDLDLTDVTKWKGRFPPHQSSYLVHPTGTDGSLVGGRFTMGMELERKSSPELGDPDLTAVSSSSAVLSSDVLSSDVLESEQSEPGLDPDIDILSSMSTTGSDTDDDPEASDQSVTEAEEFESNFLVANEDIQPNDDPANDVTDDTDSDDEPKNDNGETAQLIDGGEHGRVPSTCLAHTCNDEECEYCAGHGLGGEQDEAAYVNSEEENLKLGDSDDDDDEEHYDSDECIGMLYHPREPAILLACTEIRDACLPVYYGQNAFSWRFFWLDVADSKQSFLQWAQQMGDAHVKYIRRLSLESRHIVEEGVEIGVDIDLINVAPFFKVNLRCADVPDNILGAILTGLRIDMDRILKILQSPTGIYFTVTSLCEIGKTFIEWMQRNPFEADGVHLDNVSSEHEGNANWRCKQKARPLSI